jgi:hypothetical protein
MAGFRFPMFMAPAAPSGSEWVDRVIPEPHGNSSGLVYDPTALGWAPEVTPYRYTPQAMTFADTGFAEYLRRNRQPIDLTPSLIDMLMWWRRR